MLAARLRGLGTAWTTLHLQYEREVAEVLELPDDVHQGTLIPTAHYTGETFRPALVSRSRRSCTSTPGEAEARDEPRACRSGGLRGVEDRGVEVLYSAISCLEGPQPPWLSATTSRRASWRCSRSACSAGMTAQPLSVNHAPRSPAASI